MASDPRTAHRLGAELRARWHAAMRPFHRIAIARDEDAQCIALWCPICEVVFLDRVPPPRTVRGIIEKAKRHNGGQP
ncbi:MAG: hypothetical protein ACYC2H_01395 [Thermoplasmatota archaeon]